MRKHLLPLFLPALLASAADPRGDNPDTQPSSPEAERAMFHLPPGFTIQLVASEPEIQKPINLNFDSHGRLWVTGSELYPWPAARDAAGDLVPGFDKTYAEIATTFARGAKAPEASTEGRDSIRILSDFDSSGHARKITLFASGLSIPGGVQPLPRAAGAKGDAAVVYSIPYIWRLEDTTGSGVADRRERLFGPFGFLDTHGGSASYIQWMDGWIYGTHGFRNHSEVGFLQHPENGGQVLDSGNTYRFRPDGSAFEYYTHGQTNPFGLTFDSLGNLYSADSHSKPVYMLLHGGWYEGIGKQDDGLGFAPRITDDDHGSSAIAGIACYTDNQWPEEFHENLFNGNPVTRRVNCDRLEWHGSTPRALRQPDFIVSDDPWFRPVQVKLGPDGALYIADFYNAIIGHYEVPLTHPARDHSHGRIWRVVYEGQKTLPPDLAALSTPELTKKLGDPNAEVRRLAVNELVEARGAEALSALHSIPADASALERAAVLWALSRLEPAAGVPAVSEPEAVQVLLARRGGERWDKATTPLAIRASLENTTEFIPEDLPKLLALWAKSPAEDMELIHTVRMAGRNLLVAHPEAYRLTAGLTPADQDRVAELSLGAADAPSADFLLSYLQARHFDVPRPRDCVKHLVS